MPENKNQNHVKSHGKFRVAGHVLASLLLLMGLISAGSGFLSPYLHPEEITSFPQCVYLFRIVPFAILAAVLEAVIAVIRKLNENHKNTA